MTLIPANDNRILDSKLAQTVRKILKGQYND